jgi:hypothetical protein
VDALLFDDDGGDADGMLRRLLLLQPKKATA